MIVIIPPVTVLPASGSRLQILSIVSIISLLFVVEVAETNQLFLGIFWQNLSGLPNSGLCRAKFFHSVQLPPNSSVGGAGVSLSPYVELSVILPFVTKTRSSTVSLIDSALPCR